jgi:hypothetical protein
MPLWSWDGKYVYYQDMREGDQPIFRVRLSDRWIERMTSSRQIPQSDISGYSLCALGADDAPFAAVSRSNSDIYALDVDLP